MPLNLATYYFILLVVNGICIIQLRHIKRPDTIICALLALTLAEEIVAFVLMRTYKNNLIAYHIYSPIEFFIISLYFNYSIRMFRRRNIGIGMGVLGILLGLFNTVFIQPITTINSYFLLFEGTSIIIYCLLSFHQILMEEDNLPYRFAHFWITTCFLIYWSSTFTGWGIYTVLDSHEFVLNPIFDKVLASANFAFYLGIGAIFLRYKKLIPSGA